MRFVDWQGRPAAVCGSRAWAVLSAGPGWTEVDAAEVVAAGRPTSAEDLGDRYLEALQGAGGFDALTRLAADDACEG